MKKTIRLFVTSLLIILLSAIVVKGVDSSWGSVKVRTGKTISPNGNIMSYKVYIPKEAVEENFDHIEQISQEFYSIPDYFEKEEIRKAYEYELTFKSNVFSRKKQKEEILKLYGPGGSFYKR